MLDERCDEARHSLTVHISSISSALSLSLSLSLSLIASPCLCIFFLSLTGVQKHEEGSRGCGTGGVRWWEQPSGGVTLGMLLG